MRWPALLGMVLLAACSGGTAANGTGRSPGASPSATPSVAASPSQIPPSRPLGVVATDFLVEGGPSYSVSIIGADGKVLTRATAAKRSHPRGQLVQMPSVSASATRLYYLDGDSTVRFLTPGGVSGIATTLPVDSSSAAVFAVSPDDIRIAVALITYPYPAKTRIYVEDLSGGGNHVELFSSSTALEWPVGWHEGRLVIGVGLNVPPQNAYEGFAYAYLGYHVADAASGARLATICAGYSTFGPPVPAGTTCYNYPAVYERVDWSGAYRPLAFGNGCGGGALSPGGTWVADTCTGGGALRLVALDGTVTVPPFTASPEGWIDDDDLVLKEANGQLTVLKVSVMKTTPIQASGFFAGSIPGGL